MSMKNLWFCRFIFSLQYIPFFVLISLFLFISKCYNSFWNIQNQAFQFKKGDILMDFIKEALSMGFADAAIMDTKDLVFVPEYRQFCDDNLCGK